jgi:hypothetical protein
MNCGGLIQYSATGLDMILIAPKMDITLYTHLSR